MKIASLSETTEVDRWVANISYKEIFKYVVGLCDLVTFVSVIYVKVMEANTLNVDDLVHINCVLLKWPVTRHEWAYWEGCTVFCS